jgi:hypothetical protein
MESKATNSEVSRKKDLINSAIGHAISHTLWSLYLQVYFPGLVTAQISRILGPFVAIYKNLCFLQSFFSA